MQNIADRLAYWTHPSITGLADEQDPVNYVVGRARGVVFDAIQKGWVGPPFDPFDLARLSGIELAATENVIDARTLPAKGEKLLIEYNANRPKNRVRFSVAHEVAHSLFPDCRDYVRERQMKHQMRNDDWQLEMLCNIAAAEFLMPIGSFPELKDALLGLDRLMELRTKYEVSIEAILIRSVRLTKLPYVVFCCSRREEGTGCEPYFLDYAISSQAITTRLEAGLTIPQGSVVEECTAIGYTAKGDEAWPGGLGRVHVECVGLPAYPLQPYPRVAGLLHTPGETRNRTNEIRYLKGDATEPRGVGPKIIAFIVNDKGRSWGAGFARAVQKKWPFVLEEFQTWISKHQSEFSLGNVNVSRIDSDVEVVEMVAQHGYGESTTPRIRYQALQQCLEKLAIEAEGFNATIHMPKIGCGEAGGSWWIVGEMIESFLCRRGISVTVYDLPEKHISTKQGQMNFL